MTSISKNNATRRTEPLNGNQCEQKMAVLKGGTVTGADLEGAKADVKGRPMSSAAALQWLQNLHQRLLDEPVAAGGEVNRVAELFARDRQALLDRPKGPAKTVRGLPVSPPRELDGTRPLLQSVVAPPPPRPVDSARFGSFSDNPYGL